jgi:hypothetical protein
MDQSALLSFAGGITTWLGLLSFAVVLYFLYKRRELVVAEKSFKEGLAAGKPEDVPSIIERLSDRMHIDLGKLPEAARAQVVLEELRNRRVAQTQRLLFAAFVLVVVGGYVIVERASASQQHRPTREQARVELEARLAQVSELMAIARTRIDALDDIPDGTVLNGEQRQSVRLVVDGIGATLAAPRHIGLFRNPTAPDGSAVEQIGSGGYGPVSLPAKAGFLDQRFAAVGLAALFEQAGYPRPSDAQLRGFYGEIAAHPLRHGGYELILMGPEVLTHSAAQARAAISDAVNDFRRFEVLWADFTRR